MLEVARESFLSVSTSYYSCFVDTLSDKQDEESVYSSYSTGNQQSSTEPEPITIEHYEQIRNSLRNPTRIEPPNFRSDAREKLARLTRVQFLEFAMDVHDEVTRIKTNKPPSTTVPPRGGCSAHRNEARQKIANLRPGLLQELMSDIFFELGRRYPKFKETRESYDQEMILQPSPEISSLYFLGVRTPLTPLDAEANLSDLVLDGIITSATEDLNSGCVDTISGTMSVAEIISILGHHGCPDITNTLDMSKCGAGPIAGGGFGDIYQGQLNGGFEIAIKCPRFFVHRSEINRSEMKAAARELHAWSKYNHPNVLELLGVAQFQDRIAMISPWMRNGTLTRYLQRTPKANRHKLCRDIACGVAYLHRMSTVHGDIKGLNVLISHDGTAKLIDFGNSSLKNSTLKFTGTQNTASISIRWTAPELLVNGGACTLEADVYALGMTILEVITGQIPFPEVVSEPAVITKVAIEKKHPERPLDLVLSNRQNDALWAILTRCWSQDPLARPSASEVASRLTKIKTEGRRASAYPDEFGRLVSSSMTLRRSSRRLG